MGVFKKLLIVFILGLTDLVLCENRGKFKDAKQELTVGEEMEIELSMFVNEEEQGKIYKDRFNFASFDCGATIVKTNKEAKNAGSILNENKDFYLLNPCYSNKYVIIELCEDILVDEIEISNFEFYSSMFKDFRISASERFPTQNWVVLGEFEASNIRYQQRFQIENPLIWSKFIKVEIISHYGDEYYCPISSIQIFGTTMIEQLKEEEEGFEIKEKLNETINISDNSHEHQEQREQQETMGSESEIIDYTTNIKFREIDYEEDCIARPEIPLNKFFNQFGHSKSQCLTDKSIQEQSITSTKISTTKIAPVDSIYKNINKRLDELERNATIALLYQEQQSKLLSDAFIKFESLQLERFQNLINEINSTHYYNFDILKRINKDIKIKNQLLSKEIMKFNEEQNSIKLNKISILFNEIWWLKIIILSIFIILLIIIFKLIELTNKHELLLEKRALKEGEAKVAKKSI